MSHPENPNHLADHTRTAHALRLVIVAAFVVLGVIYAFATPILEKNDEESHLWFVRHLALGDVLPVQVPGTPDAALHREGSQPPFYYALAALALRPFDTSNFDQQLQPNASPSFSPFGVGNKNLLIITPEKRAFNYRGTTLAALVLRLLSILPGAVTVWLSYFIAFALIRRTSAALLAMGFVAFNPMFITVSSAVGNDILVIALSTLALAVLVQLILHGPTRKRLIVTGVVLALASLSKVSGLLLLPIAALAIIGREWLATANTHWRDRLVRIAQQGGVLLVLWALIAGWWYARNVALYGDFTGAAVMAQMMTPRDISVAQALAEFGGFRMSFLAIFGQFSIPADTFVYPLFDALLIAAGAGLLIGLVRLLRHRDWQASQPMRLRLLTCGLFAFYVVSLLLSILRWTLSTPASHGRLLFPALGALATLVALSLRQWEHLFARLRVNQSGLIPVLVVVPMFVLSVVTPWRYILPAYALPLLNAVPTNMTPVNQRMGALAELLAYQMTPMQMHPGEVVRVSAALRALSVPRDNYLLVVKLYGLDNTELARFDTFTGGGLYPSSQWRVGDLWRDEMELTIPDTARAPGILRVQFELYNRGSGELVHSSSNGQAGAPLFDGSTLLPQPVPAPGAPLATFGDIGALVAFTHTALLPGQPMTVTLTWHSLRQADKDYTVFVHLLDASNKPVAQHDGPPAAGNFPTSRWAGGITFVDAHTLNVPAQLPSGPYRLVVGLYDRSTGERLIVRDGSQNEEPDRALVLAQFALR